MTILLVILGLASFSQTGKLNPSFNYMDRSVQKTLRIGQYEKLELGIATPSAILDSVTTFVNHSESAGETNYFYDNYPGLNPYDPEDISLECSFVNQTTRETYKVYGFYYEEFEYLDSDSIVTVDETDAVNWQIVPTSYQWRVLFAPPTMGVYAVSGEFVYKNGQTISEIDITPPSDFTTVVSDNKGYLQIANNNRYLEFSKDGLSSEDKFFFGMGANISIGPNEAKPIFINELTYEHASIVGHRNLLTKLAENGGNLVRILMGTGSYNFEHEQLGSYQMRQNRSWEFDKVMDLCSDINLYVDMNIEVTANIDEWSRPTFDDNEAYQHWIYPWQNSPYNEDARQHSFNDGGPLKNGLIGVDSREEFFDNNTAKKYYKNKLRYIMSRWGYSPNIAFYEIINELDHILKLEVPSDSSMFLRKALGWIDDMADYMRDLDNNHLITSNNGSLSILDIYQSGKLDFVTYHHYGKNKHTFYERSRKSNNEYKNVGNSVVNVKDMPFFYNESGIRSRKQDSLFNQLLTNIHRRKLAWASAVSGSFSSTLHYVWKLDIETGDYYNRNLNALSEFYKEIHINGNSTINILNSLVFGLGQTDYADFTGEVFPTNEDRVEFHGLQFSNALGKKQVIGWVNHVNSYFKFSNNPIISDLPLYVDDGGNTNHDKPNEKLTNILNASLEVVLIDTNKKYVTQWYKTYNDGGKVDDYEEIVQSTSSGKTLIKIPTLVPNINHDDPMLQGANSDFAFKVIDCETFDHYSNYEDWPLNYEPDNTYSTKTSIVKAPDSPTYFYINADREICAFWYSGGSSFNNNELIINGPIAKENSDLVFYDGSLYAISSSGNILVFTYTKPIWEYEEIPLGLYTISSDYTKFIIENDKVFYIDNLGRVCALYKLNGIWTIYPLKYSSTYKAKMGSDIIMFQDKIFYINHSDKMAYFKFNFSILKWEYQALANIQPRVNSDFSKSTSRLFFIDNTNRVSYLSFSNKTGSCISWPLDYSRNALTGTGTNYFDNKVYFVTSDNLVANFEYKQDMLSLEGKSDWMFSFVYPCQEFVKSNSSFYVDNLRIVYVREDGKISGIYAGNGKLKVNEDEELFWKDEYIQEGLGIKAADSFVKIIPNPNNGNFTLESNLTKDAKVLMVDLLGNIVYQNEFKDCGIDNVEISNIPNGVYIVQVYQNNQLILREKVIVN